MKYTSIHRQPKLTLKYQLAKWWGHSFEPVTTDVKENDEFIRLSLDFLEINLIYTDDNASCSKAPNHGWVFQGLS